MSELHRYTENGWKNLNLGLGLAKDSDFHIFGKGQMRMIFDKASAIFLGDPFNVDFRLTPQAYIGESTPKEFINEDVDFPQVKTGALLPSTGFLRQFNHETYGVLNVIEEEKKANEKRVDAFIKRKLP
jgi:hypothetical protein